MASGRVASRAEQSRNRGQLERRIVAPRRGIESQVGLEPSLRIEPRLTAKVTIELALERQQPKCRQKHAGHVAKQRPRAREKARIGTELGRLVAVAAHALL